MRIAKLRESGMSNITFSRQTCIPKGSFTNTTVSFGTLLPNYPASHAASYQKINFFYSWVSITRYSSKEVQKKIGSPIHFKHETKHFMDIEMTQNTLLLDEKFRKSNNPKQMPYSCMLLLNYMSVIETTIPHFT